MNLTNLRLLSLNIKEYLVDIFILLILGFLTSLIVQSVYFDLLHKVFPSFDIFPLTLEVIKILLWIIFYLFFKWFLDEKFKALFKHNAYKFGNKELKEDSFLKDWIFQGNVQSQNGELLISNANSGCLMRSGLLKIPFLNIDFLRFNNIWKNFIAEMEINFPKQKAPLNPHKHADDNNECYGGCAFNKNLGIIFRAQNFDDYFMLEIIKLKNHLILKPHVRFGGNWDAPILNIDNNSMYLPSLPIKLKIKVIENVVEVSSNSNTIRWLLPTHFEINLIHHQDNKDSLLKTTISEVYFRNRAGMFGFRCYGNQIALIKSLSIKGI